MSEVDEKQAWQRFLQRVMTEAGVTPSELSTVAAWKLLAPEIAKIAIDEGLTVKSAGLSTSSLLPEPT
jgi:hypothetical protein